MLVAAGSCGANRGYADTVSTGRDDDALSWAGDEDPTLDAGARGRGVPATPVADGEPVGEMPVADETPVDETPESVGDDSSDEAPQASNAGLISYGILGGVYLLYTIGWLIGGSRLQGFANYLVSDVAYIPAFWAAVCAPALWFGTVFVLTGRSAAWVRIALLVGGVVVLVPWPFIMLGAVGR